MLFVCNKNDSQVLENANAQRCGREVRRESLNLSIAMQCDALHYITLHCTLARCASKCIEYEWCAVNMYAFGGAMWCSAFQQSVNGKFNAVSYLFISFTMWTCFRRWIFISICVLRPNCCAVYVSIFTLLFTYNHPVQDYSWSRFACFARLLFRWSFSTTRKFIAMWKFRMNKWKTEFARRSHFHAYQNELSILSIGIFRLNNNNHQRLNDNCKDRYVISKIVFQSTPKHFVVQQIKHRHPKIKNTCVTQNADTDFTLSR